MVIDSELRMGIKEEAEHKRTIRWLKKFVKKNDRFPSDEEIQKNVASDHLRENKDYYSKLAECGL